METDKEGFFGRRYNAQDSSKSFFIRSNWFHPCPKNQIGWVKFSLHPMKSGFRKRLAIIVATAQALLPVTRSELLFVSVLLGGLTVGAVLKQWSYSPRNEQVRSNLLRIADSLAAVEMTTFTGTTSDAEPVTALRAADTVVKKPQRFPLHPKPGKITSGTIHLSSATAQDLMRLPGVGEATAQKILEARAEQRFKRIEDVMRVKGIGKKKFKAMKKFLEL
jgi:competence ComEA-like helix-hairpin-helix protein